MSEYTINKIEYDGNIYNLQDANAGTGTVTSIGISNATNGGLSVSGSPVTTSGSITVGHSNVLDSAQTTQAVYPIKIDKNGHISEYGSAVTIPDVSGKIDTAGTGLSKSGTTLNHTNSITAQTTSAVYPIKIDAQGHISEYDSAVTIPTNTNQLTNGAGFITSPNIPYCTCDTAAATIAKVATVVSGTFTADNMVTGAQIIVKFTNNNTKSDATLKVGSTDVKTIKRYGTTSTSTSAATSWNAGSCILFIYDGTYWQMAGWLNSTYSEASVAEITSSSSSTARLISGRRAKSAVEAFESITDVTVGGISVVNNRVAEIPEVNADIVVHLTITQDPDTTLPIYTADMTYAEIVAEVAAEHSVVLVVHSEYEDEEAENGIYIDGYRYVYYLTECNIDDDSLPLCFTRTRCDGYNSIQLDSFWIGSSNNIWYETASLSADFLTTKPYTADMTYYLLGVYDQNQADGFVYKNPSLKTHVTADSVTSGHTRFELGNSTATSSAGGKEGIIRFYGTAASYYTDLKSSATGSNKTITLPDATGTIALTSDIPTITLNGSSTASPSFYAPTAAGTFGTYLRSSGAGSAPTWQDIPEEVIIVKVTGSVDNMGNEVFTSEYTYFDILYEINLGHSVFAELHYLYEEEDDPAKELFSLVSYNLVDDSIPIVFTQLYYSDNTEIASQSIYFTCLDEETSIELRNSTIYNPNWSKETTSNTFYPLLSTSYSSSYGDMDTIGGVDIYQYYNSAGGYRRLDLGNSTAYKTSGGAYGAIRLYGTGATYYGDLNPGTIGDNSLTANRTWTLPDKTGTIALTSDIPTIPSNNVTGSGSTNYLAEWSGTNTLSSTSLYFNTSYNSGSDSYGTIKLYVGSTGQIDWRGQLVFHDGSSSKTITITPPSLTASRTLTLPDKTGTIALTSDIPDVSGKIDTAGIGLSKSGTTLKAKLNSETAITDTSKVYYLGVDSDGYLITKVGWSDIQTRTSDSGTARTIYLAGGTTSSDETGGLSKHASISATVSANSATAGTSYLTLGNSTASSTAGGKEGYVRLYGSSTSYTDLKVSAATSAKTITFPDKTGTVALTSDIPTVPTITLNGSSTTSPSFYAPTGVGTSGYVLTSNGSGAPSWSNSTATPTTSTISKFDSSAKMNSTDMSSSDIDTFIAGLNTGVSDYIQRSELGDYVIEQSSSGTHYYKIYNSGKKEVWGMFTETCDSMTAFGTNTGLYRVTKTLALPTYMTAGITTVECLNATVISTGGSGYCTAWSAYISNNTNLVITIIGSAANAGDVKFSYHIIGN